MRSLVPLDSRDLSVLACPWCGRTPRGATFGLKAMRDGQVVGALAAAAASDLGGFYPPGSVVVVQWWVRREDLGELIGTQLGQRLAAQAHARRVRSIVAHGTRGVPDCRHLPADFLESRGFVECAAGAQWRFDLRRTLRIPEAVKCLVDAAVRVVRPERPAPAGRQRVEP